MGRGGDKIVLGRDSTNHTKGFSRVDSGVWVKVRVDLTNKGPPSPSLRRATKARKALRKGVTEEGV
jgi:hypothetical protein